MKIEIKYTTQTVEVIEVRQVVFKDGILKVSTKTGKLFELYGEEFVSFKVKEELD